MQTALVFSLTFPPRPPGRRAGIDMAIGIEKVTLVSILVESVLYGFFVILFFISTGVILSRRYNRDANEGRPNKTLLSVLCTMFVLSTVHLGSDMWRLLDAFLGRGKTLPGGSAAYLADVSTPIYSLKSTAYAMQTLVGDGFILYRLSLVWNGNKFVCAPIALTFVASIGVGIGALQGFARVSPDQPVFITELHDWIVSFFTLTLFTNLCSTALIAGRILWVQRRITGLLTSHGIRDSLSPAAIIVIESGAIYSICLIMLLSLYLSGSYAQYILLDAVTQVVGIVFSLVIVCVALGISKEGAQTQNNRTSLAFRRTSVQTRDSWQQRVPFESETSQKESQDSELSKNTISLNNLKSLHYADP